MTGNFPDLELPPTLLTLTPFPSRFTAFIIINNCAEKHTCHHCHQCFVNFNIMFHVFEFEIGILVVYTCIDT